LDQLLTITLYLLKRTLTLSKACLVSNTYYYETLTLTQQKLSKGWIVQKN
jgi:hypothetical protein